MRAALVYSDQNVRMKEQNENFREQKSSLCQQDRHLGNSSGLRGSSHWQPTMLNDVLKNLNDEFTSRGPLQRLRNCMRPSTFVGPH